MIFSILIFSQCQKEDPSEMDATTPNPIDTLDQVEPIGVEQYLNEDSDYLFDQNKLHTLELNIPNLSAIDNDPAAEEYVSASITFEGETLSPVGVRYKGSIGAFAECLSGPSIFEPNGFKTCTKLSMKVKINWQGREDKFYGLRKIQLHSMNNDPSQMRERLGYWLFDQMGIPSPRAVHVKLKINGEYVGLFVMVEQIDGRFTKYHLDDGDGNVYKELWPLSENGNPHSDATYRNALKTNEDQNTSIDIIKGLALDVKNASTDNELKAAISKWTNTEKLINYAMVDRTIKHDDGPFHWYCFQGCSPHNFYFIEEPSKEKIHLVPWDLDHAFTNYTAPNPVTMIPDDWGETRNNCQAFSTGGFFGVLQRSAACDKLIYGMTLFEEEFANSKIEFDNGPFSEENINGLLQTWSDQIRDATIEASEKHNDALRPVTWDQQVDELKLQCRIARD